MAIIWPCNVPTIKRMKHLSLYFSFRNIYMHNIKRTQCIWILSLLFFYLHLPFFWLSLKYINTKFGLHAGYLLACISPYLIHLEIHLTYWLKWMFLMGISVCNIEGLVPPCRIKSALKRGPRPCKVATCPIKAIEVTMPVPPDILLLFKR